MALSSYAAPERNRLLRSRVGGDDHDAVKVRYKMRPPSDGAMEEVALSCLMVLTLRSRRYPKSSSRTGVINSAGYVAELDRASHTFWLVLSPPEGSRFVDVSTVLNLVLAPVEYDFADDVWIEQIVLPSELEKSLGGPALGVEGIRDLFPDRRGYPLLGFTISNRISDWNHTLEHVSGAVRGGVDFLADDILDVSGYDTTSCLSRLERIQGVLSECGKPDLPYFLNLCSFRLMSRENAKQLLDGGAAGFIINPYVTGWDHANWFRKVIGANGAVLHTNMGSGLCSRYASSAQHPSVATGMAEGVTSYLSRVTGADGVHAGTADTACFDKDWHRPIEVLWERYEGIRTSFRIAEGDITPNNLFGNMMSLGSDILIEANSAIYGHPDGPECGAQAFKEMIDLVDSEWDQDVDIIGKYILPKASKTLKRALEAFESTERD